MAAHYKEIECLCNCVMVLKCLNEKVTRGPRPTQNTANTLYYFWGGATSSTSSGFRGVSLTLNKTEGYERSVYEAPALNANRFAALFSRRRPPLPLGEPRTQLLSSLLKTKHQTTKGEKSSDGDEEAREAAQEVAPAASCRITNKTASRHLAPRRDVHEFGCRRRRQPSGSSEEREY